MTGNEDGLTLVELMVVLMLAAVVTAVIYQTFPAQQKAAISQEQVTEMQQQVRAAMHIMTREIRMAGYNPLRVTSNASCGTWILTAKNDEIRFAMDVTGGESDGVDNDGDGEIDELDEEADGDCNDKNETITYLLYTDADGIQTLGRRYSLSESAEDEEKKEEKETTYSIAENIEAVGFAYAFDADGDGTLDKANPHDDGPMWAVDNNSDGELDLNLDTNHDGQVDELDNPAGVPLYPTIPLDAIRAVKIWLLGRSEQPDTNFTNNTTYAVANQRITVNDGYRRRLLSTTVYCRNMGL